MAFRRSITLALFGEHMHQHCVIYLFGLFKKPHHLLDIMTVHRSKVSHAHILKKHAGYEYLLKGALIFLEGIYNLHALGYLLKSLFHTLFHFDISIRSPYALQIPGDASHIFGDGHTIVIEDYDKIGP